MLLLTAAGCPRVHKRGSGSGSGSGRIAGLMRLQQVRVRQLRLERVVGVPQLVQRVVCHR